jgi:soluble P-type ATPase
MSTATRFSYDYVFEIASQLSTEEQERLIQEMRAPSKKIEMVEYTVPGTPIISQEDIEEIQHRVNSRVSMDTPDEIEKNRQELLEILLNCPVMTDEELKGFEEARKEINECRLAYL